MTIQTSPTQSNVSPAQSFASLPEVKRTELLNQLDDRAKAALAYDWQNWLARPNQKEPEGDWLFWLILSGRGFGKTRMGSEWVREQVKKFPRVALIGKDAADMRSVMIEGESGILEVCPPWERPEYRPSTRSLHWPNGALSELRTGEDPDGVRGIQFDRLWMDEIAAWQYPQETWDNAMLALRLGEDTRACITTTPKPIRLIRDLVRDPDCVVTRGSTYDNLDNLSPQVIKIVQRYEGTRLGRQEIYGELLEDEGLAYRFSEQVHVIPELNLAAEFERFESMDYGSNNPTCWLAWAVDYDGNLICFDEFYAPGLPSQLAPVIKTKRAVQWRTSVCWADPSLWIGKGVTNKWGREANSADEFSDAGIELVRANNDRRAGYLRMSELLAVDSRRSFPAWHKFAGRKPAPRMFISTRCTNLIEQLKDAPLESSEPGPTQGPHPGEAVAVKWEGAHGHAHASARYGVMSRPLASEEQPRPPENPEWSDEQRLKAEFMWERARKRDEALSDPRQAWEFV